MSLASAFKKSAVEITSSFPLLYSWDRVVSWDGTELFSGLGFIWVAVDILAPDGYHIRVVNLGVVIGFLN